METFEQWSQLVDAVFEQPVASLDMVCLHGWDDLADEMLKRSAEVFQASQAKYLVINGAEEYEVGKKGLSYFHTALIDTYGIAPEKIIATAPAMHTGAEAEAFTAAMKKYQATRVGIISVPQHIVRAYLTSLGISREKGLERQLYPYTIAQTTWREVIDIKSASGVSEQTSRLGRFAGECARIVEYRARFEAGDQSFAIASITEGLFHLQKKS